MRIKKMKLHQIQMGWAFREKREPFSTSCAYLSPLIFNSRGYFRSPRFVKKF